MTSNIHAQAIVLASKLCQAHNIILDPPRFESRYSSLHLDVSHEVKADFYIRKCSVGMSIQLPDLSLYYLLKEMIRNKQLQLVVPGSPDGYTIYVEPDNWQVGNTPFYIVSIASRDLRHYSNIEISPDPTTFEKRSTDLAILLFNEWIMKIMPIVQSYKNFRNAGLLKAA